MFLNIRNLKIFACGGLIILAARFAGLPKRWDTPYPRIPPQTLETLGYPPPGGILGGWDTLHHCYSSKLFFKSRSLV